MKTFRVPNCQLHSNVLHRVLETAKYREACNKQNDLNREQLQVRYVLLRCYTTQDLTLSLLTLCSTVILRGARCEALNLRGRQQ